MTGEEGMAQLENLHTDPSTCDSKKLSASGGRRAKGPRISLPRARPPEGLLCLGVGMCPPSQGVSPGLSLQDRRSQRRLIDSPPPRQEVPAGPLDAHFHCDSPKTLVTKPPALPLGSVPLCSITPRWQGEKERTHTPSPGHPGELLRA